jgi:hypothetical protein
MNPTGGDCLLTLRHHAGLGGPLGNATSLIDVVTDGSNLDSAALRACMTEIEVALQQMNLSANGPTPSDSVERVAQLPRSAIAAMAAISETLTRAIVEHPEARDILAWSAWRTACAWEAVLAGDIDDIQEHCALEESALRRS